MSVSVRLVSPTTQNNAPFAFGQIFKRGEFPSSVVCGLLSYQATVLRRWDDGSVKHASISGFTGITAGTNSPLFDNSPTTIVLSPGTPPTGIALTAASIASFSPSASVQCGTIGTVNLSPLLATPFQTFQSGPQMVECVYRGDVGGTQLAVWFYIRCWAGGRMRIMYYVENGYVDNGAGARAVDSTETYVPTAIINGVTVFNNGGTAFSHYPHTGWSGIGWIGGDPQITALHDPVYLVAAGPIPNYELLTPATSTLDGLAMTYTPFGSAEFTPGMGAGGFQSQIGILPRWDALYSTTGDIRAFRAAETASRSFRSYGVCYRSKLSNKAIKPSLFATWSRSGPNAGGTDELGGSGGLTYERNHAPSAGYLIYCVTADPFHLDTIAIHASAIYLTLSTYRGLGVNRRINTGQIRGIAWSHRTVGQYAAIAPTTDDVADEYRTWLKNDYDYWYTQGPGSSTASQLGYPIAIGNYGSGPQAQAPWQYHFMMQVNGHISDAQPGFSDTTNQIAFRNWMYKGAVGILGPTGSANYYWSKCAVYNLTISSIARAPDTTEYNADTFFATWGEVFTATHGFPNNETATALEVFPGGSLDFQGYHAQLEPSIAMGVDHGATGAAAAWARFSGASNFATYRNGGFNNTPNFSIVPRATTLPGGGGGVGGTTPIAPTSGRSTRVETPAMMAARTQVGNSGMGLLGSEMAATGVNGPGYIFPALSLPADANFEVSGEITRSPIGGTFTTYENGSFFYLGPTDYFLWLLKIGGIPSTTDIGYGPGISRVDMIAGGTSVLSGAVVLGKLTTTGSFSQGIIPGNGTIVTVPIKNNAGIVQANLPNVIINVYDAVSGVLVAHITGLTSNAQGVVTFTFPTMVPGVDYAYEPDLTLTGHGRRLRIGTAQ